MPNLIGYYPVKIVLAENFSVASFNSICHLWSFCKISSKLGHISSDVWSVMRIWACQSHIVMELQYFNTINFFIMRVSRLVIGLKIWFFVHNSLNYKKTRKHETFYRCHCHDCCRFCTRLQWKMWPRIEQMQIRLWFQRLLLGEMQPKLLQMPWPMLISVQVIEFCTEIKKYFSYAFQKPLSLILMSSKPWQKTSKDEATVKILWWKVNFLWNLFLTLVHELAKHFCFWCKS